MKAALVGANTVQGPAAAQHWLVEGEGKERGLTVVICDLPVQSRGLQRLDESCEALLRISLGLDDI